jgi:hypothetical protein
MKVSARLGLGMSYEGHQLRAHSMGQYGAS